VKSRCKQLFKRIQSSSPSEPLDSLHSVLVFLEEFCAEVLKLETYSNKRKSMKTQQKQIEIQKQKLFLLVCIHCTRKK